jgi:predicted nucleic-acid-binding protein
VIGLDTNVLVRYLAQDDPRQSAAATRLIEDQLNAERPGFVSHVSLVELVWVLESCYESSKDEVAEVLGRLLHAKQIVAQDAETVWKALRRFKAASADFADCLIDSVGKASQCEFTATFDKQAARAGMTLLES